MTDPNLQPPEPIGYRATAAELRRIADIFDAYGAAGVGQPYVDFRIMAPQGFTAAERVEFVDGLAHDLFGEPGRDEQLGGGWYHQTRRYNAVARMTTFVVAEIPAPPDERDAELAVLRAEVMKLRAAALTPDDLSPERDAEDCPGGDGPCICPESVE